MLDTGLPDFYRLEDALLRLDADFSASEAHGCACGVLTVNNDYPQVRWQTFVLTGDAQDYHFQEASKMLASLYVETLLQINASDLQFELLLPPEQEALSVRVAALQKWCQGFAFGLAASGLKSMEALPEDSRDWVQDVIKIGAARDLEVDDEDESEQAYSDLVEFMRVGVLMMNEEVQPIQGVPELENDSCPTLH